MRFAKWILLVFLFALWVSVSTAQAQSAEPRTITVPYTLGSQGLIQIPCQTETGKTYACTLDTGAARSVGASYTAITVNSSEQAELTTVSGSGGAAVVPTYLTISGQRFRIPLMVWQGRKKLGFDILLGQDVLRQFKSVTVDYVHHVVIFAK